jgi:catalase
MLLQDTQLIETLAHFNREPIPERVVHASAVGAWGEFEVTHDNSDITSAAWLNGIGKKSKVLARISTVGANRGSAETIRDMRGFSWKVFTEEGNQDFVFNSMVSATLYIVLRSSRPSSSGIQSSFPRSTELTSGYPIRTHRTQLW